MTTQERNLLLKDICCRLPHHTMVLIMQNWNGETYNALLMLHHLEDIVRDKSRTIKPYLRKMSSMTEEERAFYNYQKEGYCSTEYACELIDWLNAHYFDYRGLIDKGLALEAPEGMYSGTAVI